MRVLDYSLLLETTGKLHYLGKVNKRTYERSSHSPPLKTGCTWNCLEVTGARHRGTTVRRVETGVWREVSVHKRRVDCPRHSRVDTKGPYRLACVGGDTYPRDDPGIHLNKESKLDSCINSEHGRS